MKKNNQPKKETKPRAKRVMKVLTEEERIPMLNKYGKPIYKLRTDGKPRCHFVRKDGTQCNRIASTSKGRDVCVKHGANAGRHIVTGKHSKYNLGTLQQHFERISSSEIKDFTDEVQLVRAQLQEVIDESEKEEVIVDKFGNMVIDDDGKAKVRKMDVLSKAAAVDKLVNSIIGHCERLHEFQKEQKQIISIKALEYIINQLIVIIDRFIEDKPLKSIISHEIKQIRVPDELR